MAFLINVIKKSICLHSIRGDKVHFPITHHTTGSLFAAREVAPFWPLKIMTSSIFYIQSTQSHFEWGFQTWALQKYVIKYIFKLHNYIKSEFFHALWLTSSQTIPKHRPTIQQLPNLKTSACNKSLPRRGLTEKSHFVFVFLDI